MPCFPGHFPQDIWTKQAGGFGHAEGNIVPTAAVISAVICVCVWWMMSMSFIICEFVKTSCNLCDMWETWETDVKKRNLKYDSDCMSDN